MTAPDQPLLARSKRNLWKLGFFVMLLLFEFTREWAILAEAKGATLNGSALVSTYGGFATAQGRWVRIDGGSKLMPALVTIDCRRDMGRCVEATTSVNEGYVYAPDISWFEATFTDDAVSYENDNPDCASYSVRIDLKLKKTFAVRQRKSDTDNANCASAEHRVEMQLADPYNRDADPTKGHFVPILSLLRTVVN